MARAKKSFRTPVLDLQWVNIQGEGKLRYEQPDDHKPEHYQYQATVVYPDEASMLKDKKVFDQFWRDNKPAGLTKQKYDMFKPEMVPDLDKTGKEQKDEDGEVIKKPTGRYTLTAKTGTVWPDGRANTIKTLRGNGTPINLGDKLIGDGSRGVIHGEIAINDYKANPGLMFFLKAVQLTKFVEKTDDLEVDELDEDEDNFNELDMDAAEAESKPDLD